MELTNLLKYERSLFPSKAVFYYKTDDCEFVPLEAEISRIQGPKADFTEGFDNKFNAKSGAAQDLAYINPLVMEECYVPPNIEHIYCQFSLRVQANSAEPTMCNNLETFNLLKEFAHLFKEQDGYQELAERYCKNILLGSWLWRNQNTGNTEVTIKTSSGAVYCISNTRKVAWDSKWSPKDLQVLKSLTGEFLKALTEKTFYWHADIIAKMEVSFCQEIYPSQILISKADQNQSEATKQFVKVKCVDGRRAVSFNSVKIGAALQFIDDWWKDSFDKRLRVHEFGADKQLGIAHRTPESGVSFYSLIVKLEQYIALLEAKKPISPDIYYLMSVLIKGGMFQKKADSKRKK